MRDGAGIDAARQCHEDSHETIIKIYF